MYISQIMGFKILLDIILLLDQNMKVNISVFSEKTYVVLKLIFVSLFPVFSYWFKYLKKY